MERAITETERRRAIQMKYNREHGIVPKTIVKDVRDVIEITSKEDSKDRRSFKKLTRPEREKVIEQMSKEMKEAARLLEFEHAAFLRDKIQELKGEKPQKPQKAHTGRRH